MLLNQSQQIRRPLTQSNHDDFLGIRRPGRVHMNDIRAFEEGNHRAQRMHKVGGLSHVRTSRGDQHHCDAVWLEGALDLEGKQRWHCFERIYVTGYIHFSREDFKFRDFAFGPGLRDYFFWVKGVLTSVMSNPRTRKRVGADPSKFKRGVDGSGFITCEKCGFSVPAGVADVHDCKLDARIKSSLECHHTIDSAVRGHPQFRSRKQQRTEAVEIQKAPKCAKKPKDPNQPKKPQTAFFVFMEEFRKKYKEDNADAKG